MFRLLYDKKNKHLDIRAKSFDDLMRKIPESIKGSQGKTTKEFETKTKGDK